MTRLGDTRRSREERGVVRATRWRLLASLIAACLLSNTTGAATNAPAPSAPLADEDGDKKNGDKKNGDKKDGEGKSKSEVHGSPAEKYVKEKLESFLSPTSIQWLEDGRCKMKFDFSKKDGSHETIFSRPIGARAKDTFRWTSQGEEFVIGGIPGIRVSDKGAVLLRAWYVDNVEAEIEYRQYINLARRHVMAVIFQNEKGSAVGANFGNQCAMFSKGSLRKKTNEKVKNVVFNATAKFKLKVEDGVFEAHRDKYLSSRQKYKPKSFPRGQIGFLWGGSLAGIVGSFEVTGKIDYEFMEKEMKKRRSRRRRR